MGVVPKFERDKIVMALYGSMTGEPWGDHVENKEYWYGHADKILSSLNEVRDVFDLAVASSPTYWLEPIREADAASFLKTTTGALRTHRRRGTGPIFTKPNGLDLVFYSRLGCAEWAFNRGQQNVITRGQRA